MDLFTISRFSIFKLATDLISIENSLSAEIRQVTDFRGLKSDQWPISVMEIGSLNQPLAAKLGKGKGARLGVDELTPNIALSMS